MSPVSQLQVRHRVGFWEGDKGCQCSICGRSVTTMVVHVVRPGWKHSWRGWWRGNGYHRWTEVWIPTKNQDQGQTWASEFKRRWWWGECDVAEVSETGSKFQWKWCKLYIHVFHIHKTFFRTPTSPPAMTLPAFRLLSSFKLLFLMTSVTRTEWLENANVIISHHQRIMNSLVRRSTCFPSSLYVSSLAHILLRSVLFSF